MSEEEQDDQDRDRQDQTKKELSLENVVELIDINKFKSTEIEIRSNEIIRSSYGYLGLYTFEGYVEEIALDYSDPLSLEAELVTRFRGYHGKKIKLENRAFDKRSAVRITISDDSLTQDRTAFTDKFRRAYERTLIVQSFENHFLLKDELFDLITRPLEPDLIRLYENVRQTLDEEEKKRTEKDLPGREEPK